jgi:hypothetical protein
MKSASTKSLPKGARVSDFTIDMARVCSDFVKAKAGVSCPYLLIDPDLSKSILADHNGMKRSRPVEEGGRVPRGNV